jgi:predicted RNase H-like HicB family nuclease
VTFNNIEALRFCFIWSSGYFSLLLGIGEVSLFRGSHSTGSTPAEAEAAIREAIVFHLDGMREDGVPVPSPSSRVEYVEVAA